MVATAKPRRRRSATTSKYFSMNSPRPWNRHTVPRRGPRVASQRAKRSLHATGAIEIPVVAPLGIGFLASATSSRGASLPASAPRRVYSSRRRRQTDGSALAKPENEKAPASAGAFSCDAVGQRSVAGPSAAGCLRRRKGRSGAAPEAAR